jgi:hypothetical protein
MRSRRRRRRKRNVTGLTILCVTCHTLKVASTVVFFPQVSSSYVKKTVVTYSSRG